MPRTLISLVWEQTEKRESDLLYSFLHAREAPTTTTYGEFATEVQHLAGYLQSLNPKKQSTALLLYPPGQEYVRAFFGCVAANVIAVPAYPPNPAALQKTLPRLMAIVKDSGAQYVLTTAAIAGMAAFLFEQAPELKACQWIATDEISGDFPYSHPDISADSLAFLQYTSGSTGKPKGVKLTHGNLLFNSELIKQGFGHSDSLRGVIWLPPYHDMGLIGGVIQPLYCGGSVALMSPLDFLKKPYRWVKAISDTQATTSGGPNFAYDLVVRKTTPEQRAELDLSSWRVAFNGAEPIRPETLDRFTNAFGDSGFKRSAFYPCYGLAEATLIVSGGEFSAEPLQTSIDKDALTSGRAETIPNGMSIVSSGQTFDKQQIAIVDPASCTRLPDDTVGEIWVSGPGVAQGYWQQPELSQQTFEAQIVGEDATFWLRTGDLGFQQSGELFVTGRIKDVIIIRGRNFYPQDIEQAVETSHPAIRPGCVAAFAVDNEAGEGMVVISEVRRDVEDTDAVIKSVRQAIASEHDLKASAILLVKAGSIPKTSSGKIQRFACRDAYLADGLDVLARTKARAAKLTTVPQQSLIQQTLSALPDRATKQTILIHYLCEQLGIAPTDVDAPITASEFPATVGSDLGCSPPANWQRCSAAQLSAILLRQLDGAVKLDERASMFVALSAESEPSLQADADQLKTHLQTHPTTRLTDLAYTQLKRPQSSLRQIALANIEHGIGDFLKPYHNDTERSITFMLPGVGDQYRHVARELYASEPVFRTTFDLCADLLYPALNCWLPELLYPAEKPAVNGNGQHDLRAMLGRNGSAEQQTDADLHQTRIAHPLVFALDYALAQQLMAWGIRPNAVIGYSLGEYVAACLAGVLSLEDALRLVAERARLIETLPAGDMLAVPLTREVAEGYCSAEISLAAHNAQALCILSGTPNAITTLAAQLKADRIAYRQLDTTHPFHSQLLAPIAHELEQIAQSITLSAPKMPLLSNVTGTWITDAEATDPNYWIRHMCGTVEFAAGLKTLLDGGEQLLIEVGPGQSLGSFAKQSSACSSVQTGWILPTLRYSYVGQSDSAFLMDTIGKMWMAGIELDVEQLFAGQAPQQIDGLLEQEATQLNGNLSRGQQRRAKMSRRKQRS